MERFAEDEPSPATLTELLVALEEASAVGFDPTHPGFLGYVPPTVLPISAVADFVGAIQGRYIGMYHPSPALVADRVDGAALDRVRCSACPLPHVVCSPPVEPMRT